MEMWQVQRSPNPRNTSIHPSVKTLWRDHSKSPVGHQHSLLNKNTALLDRVPTTSSPSNNLITPSIEKRHKGNLIKRAKWHLGIRSQSRPQDIMHEVYKAMKFLNFEWKIMNPYHVIVRYSRPHVPHYVRMSLQLYQVDHKSYLLDFKCLPSNLSGEESDDSPSSRPIRQRQLSSPIMLTQGEHCGGEEGVDSVKQPYYGSSMRVGTPKRSSGLRSKSICEAVALNVQHQCGGGYIAEENENSQENDISNDKKMFDNEDEECEDAGEEEGLRAGNTHRVVYGHQTMEFFEMCSALITQLAR